MAEGLRGRKEGRREEGVRSRRGGSRYYGEGGKKRQLLVHQPESTTSLQWHKSAVRTWDREKHHLAVSVSKLQRGGRCVNVVAEGTGHSVRVDNSLTDTSEKQQSLLKMEQTKASRKFASFALLRFYLFLGECNEVFNLHLLQFAK